MLHFCVKGGGKERRVETSERLHGSFRVDSPWIPFVLEILSGNFENCGIGVRF